jgi:hypothetical protein
LQIRKTKVILGPTESHLVFFRTATIWSTRATHARTEFMLRACRLPLTGIKRRLVVEEEDWSSLPRWALGPPPPQVGKTGFVFSAYTVGGSGNPTCITTSSIRCEMWTLAAKLNRESKTRLAPINHINGGLERGRLRRRAVHSHKR